MPLYEYRGNLDWQFRLESVENQIRVDNNGPQRLPGLRPILFEQLASQPKYRGASSRRTEIKTDKKVPVGSEFTYGWSTMLEDSEGWRRINEGWNAIWQLHGRPDVGEPWRDALLYLWNRGDHYRLRRAWSDIPINKTRDEVNKQEKIVHNPLALGVWHDFVVYAKWHYDNRGIIEFYHNGELVWEKRNTAVCYNDQGNTIAFKTGIYRSGGPELDLRMWLGRFVQFEGRNLQGASVEPISTPPDPVPEPEPDESESFEIYNGPVFDAKGGQLYRKI